MGDKKSAGGENFIGIVVCALGENSKFETSFTIPSLACSKPNLPPMHFRGPSPGKIQISCGHSKRNFKFTERNESEWLSVSDIFGVEPFWIEFVWVGIIVRITMYGKYADIDVGMCWNCHFSSWYLKFLRAISCNDKCRRILSQRLVNNHVEIFEPEEHVVGQLSTVIFHSTSNF